MRSPIPVVDVQHQAAVATAILKRFEQAMANLVDEVRAAAVSSVAELEARVTDLATQLAAAEEQVTNLIDRVAYLEDHGEQP